ncbi:MAG TPA: hypothetical protein VN958_16805 [Chitinophagaceae bacterium]|nr:hypothetical protein [Chitinophagaceae bacterium]
MKKLMIIVITLGLSIIVSAQKIAVGVHGHFGGGVYYRPHTTFVAGAYVPFYYHPFFYGYYPYYDYPAYRYYYRPTKLDLEISDIKNDYEEKIWSARHDNTLSGKERRKEVRELKHDRDQAIIDAQRNYYKQ